MKLNTYQVRGCFLFYLFEANFNKSMVNNNGKRHIPHKKNWFSVQCTKRIGSAFDHRCRHEYVKPAKPHVFTWRRGAKEKRNRRKQCTPIHIEWRTRGSIRMWSRTLLSSMIVYNWHCDSVDTMWLCVRARERETIFRFGCQRRRFNSVCAVMASAHNDIGIQFVNKTCVSRLCVREVKWEQKCTTKLCEEKQRNKKLKIKK